MSLVFVAVPVLKYRLKLHLDKGRPWSVVEHAVLQALGGKPWTIGELESAANLPRRIVIEAVVRLMRAGWVEFSSAKHEIRFEATSLGLTVAHAVELPNAPQRVVRPVSFAVDGVVGAVFSNRELFLHEDYVIKEREKTEKNIVRLAFDPEKVDYDVQEVQRLLLEDDERFVALESVGDRASQRIALVTVRDGHVVDGLPNRECAAIRKRVLEAASEVDHAESKPSASLKFAPSREPEVCVERQVQFKPSDLVLDGSRHLEVLKEVLATARSRVFIHSTFVSAEVVRGLMPFLGDAIRRGVKIDLLWGQSEDSEEVVSSRAAIDELKRSDELLQLGDLLQIHPFSSGSHAKIIVADSRRGGEFLAIVGSCNWLTSPFKSYEASVVLREPKIVADVVAVLANITHSHTGVWSDLTNELMRLANEIASLPGSKSPNARAVLVMGAGHNQFMLRARDEALQRIFVASHRLGPVSETAVVAPLSSAAGGGAVSCDVRFGRKTGAVKHKAQRRIIKSAAEDGVDIEMVERPRLHAKMLAWDTDNVLITSLNWLSSDPMSLTDTGEVGVFVSGVGLADVLVNHFENACSAVSTGER